MYQLHTLKAVRKDLKKLSPEVAKQIVRLCFPEIAKNPSHGLRLLGNLKNNLKYIFKFKGADYRIAYQINENEKTVLVIAVGPREKFYQKLINRLK